MAMPTGFQRPPKRRLPSPVRRSVSVAYFGVLDRYTTPSKDTAEARRRARRFWSWSSVGSAIAVTTPRGTPRVAARRTTPPVEPARHDATISVAPPPRLAGRTLAAAGAADG